MILLQMSEASFSKPVIRSVNGQTGWVTGLNGRPVFHLNPAGILSEGAVPGTVQIPPDGQPVVLQRDAQTTGGYAKIGVVASADFSLLVQCPLGSGQVRFSVTTVTLARERWQRKLQELQGC